MPKTNLTVWFILLFAFAIIAVAAQPAFAQDPAVATTYHSKCAVCHGADGKGATTVGQKMGAHDFGSAEVQKLSNQELNTVISKGKNKMPAYAAKLSETEISSLTAYVRQLGKGK
jgi:cytochrome c6